MSDFVQDLDKHLHILSIHIKAIEESMDEFAQKHLLEYTKPKEIILTPTQMSELKESLKKCKISGNVLSLPPISEGALPNYNEVKTALIKAGAKYKQNTFVFPDPAQPYIDRLIGGEKVNIKKEFQFFATPDVLADELVFQAQIEPTHKILEPSAGQGAIIKAIQKVFENNQSVDYCETMGVNLTFLQKIKNARPVGADFLKFDGLIKYDRIIANPPFSKNQDIQHIYKMYDCLKKGGRLVSISSKHWQNSNNKTETTFRNWLRDVKADVQEISSGAFKESGTSVASVIIIINK